MTDIDALREALEVVHHGIGTMPDSRTKARLTAELEALRTEVNGWSDPIPDGAPESIRRRVVSLQLVVSKI